MKMHIDCILILKDLGYNKPKDGEGQVTDFSTENI